MLLARSATRREDARAPPGSAHGFVLMNALSRPLAGSYCKCKRCGFCKALANEEKQEALLGPGDGAGLAQAGTWCFSGRSGDFMHEACEGFCDEANKDEHCQLCKCKSCQMCGAACSSGIAGDSLTRACSGTCNADDPKGFCPACSCRGCDFCNPDGSPSGKVHQVAAEGACIPSSDKDISVPACQGHCSESKKAAHCETCKCKGCDFCKDFKACSSGFGHDTKWVDCDATACDGSPKSCMMCKCQGCESCRSAAVEAPIVSCSSGIGGDTDYEACLPGLCSSAFPASHCQTCRCKACYFCVAELAAPPPPPPVSDKTCTPANKDDSRWETCEDFCTVKYAEQHCGLCKCKECSFCAEVPKTCSSGYLDDANAQSCEPFCDGDLELPKPFVCSFCSCKNCDFCAKVDAGRRYIAHCDVHCKLGAELLITSSKREGDNWKYDARVRVSDWQPGARMTLTFNDVRVKLRKESVEDAELLDTGIETVGSKTTSSMTVALGPEADVLNGFSFGFTVLRDGIDLKAGPRIDCSNTHDLPPSKPRPPPPPHRPFLRPPPPPPPDRLNPATCPLGGKVKILSTWGGGGSFSVRVVMAIWKAGSEVTLDFNNAVQHQSDVKGMLIASTSNADKLESPFPGALRVRLGSDPGEGHGFTMVGHEGRIHEHPLITCTIAGHAAPPPPKEGAHVDPSCIPLGILYTILTHWNGGFKAVVVTRTWQPGAMVAFDFSGTGVEVIEAWSSTQSADGSGAQDKFTLELGDHMDLEKHGFGFVVRSSPEAYQVVPTITCALDKSAMAGTAVPTSICGMGATLSLGTDEEGTTTVRVRIHQWEAGAQVTILFGAAVEIVSLAAVVTETSNGFGAEHSFELGAHPDAQHGFDFQLQSSDKVQVRSLSCKPRPSDTSAPVEVEVHALSPDPPTHIKPGESSCNSVTLSWSPAVDNGFVVTSYMVYYRRRETDDGDFQTTETPGRTVTIGGLSGGTTYFVKVRGVNSHGAGKFSSRVSVSTLSEGAPLYASGAPKAIDSPDCHSITLTLPQLRGGCRGDSYLSVQSRLWTGNEAHAGWVDTVERTAEPKALISSLEPYATYEYRVVAHNADGEAPPSASSGPVMTDAFLLKPGPPVVVASSSASFVIRLPDVAGSCRPDLRWRIMVSMLIAGDPTVTWKTLTRDATGKTYTAFPLRCPVAGCMFKLQPLGLQGWTKESSPTAPIASLPLPALDAESTRVEIKLRKAQPDRDLLVMRADLAFDLTRALSVELSSVDVRDVFGGGMYIVIDLHPAEQAEGEPVTSSELLAQQLQLLVRGVTSLGGGGLLRKGKVSNELDPAAGVQLLTQDGRLTPIHVSREAEQKFRLLTRFTFASLVPELSETMQFVLSVAALFLIAGCAMTCARHASLVRQAENVAAGYGRVAPDEDATALTREHSLESSSANGAELRAEPRAEPRRKTHKLSSAMD